MEELRQLVLKLIEETKSAYIAADEMGYESYKKHYGKRLRKLEKILKILR